MSLQRKALSWSRIKEEKKTRNVITSSICSATSTTQLHITGVGEGQYFIVGALSSPADAGKAARFLYEQVARIVSEGRIEIVHERIFGSLSAMAKTLLVRNDIWRRYAISTKTPITYIEGNPAWGEGLAGFIIHAVLPSTSQDVWTIMDGEVPCGRGWRSDGLTHLVLQDIQALGSSFRANNKKSKSNSTFPSFPDLIGESRTAMDARLRPAGMTNKVAAYTLTNELTILSKPLQARLMIERAERILRENGASYKDVVRTWFYLSDILGWYAAFNKVRNEKYGEFGIMPGPGDRELLLPASTGIQGETPSGAVCTMDLLAVIAKNPDESIRESSLLSFPQAKRVGNPSAKKHSGQAGMTELKVRCGITNGSISKIGPSIRRLTNPSQLDAFRYGSAFARGSVVRNGSRNLIKISGTAAIDEHGVSLYPGDIRAQIDCTLGKVQALLEQEGAGFRDICSATVFVKQPEFAETFHEMASARGLGNLPCVCIVADVCREELLFEIDAEAVVKKGGQEDYMKCNMLTTSKERRKHEIF